MFAKLKCDNAFQPEAGITICKQTVVTLIRRHIQSALFALVP